MEIRVYSPQLNFLGIIENFESLIWTRKYYEPGDFELHAADTERNIALLQPGNIVTKRGSKEAGVIDVLDDEEGLESGKIIRSGKFLSGLTSDRIIKNTLNFNGTYEDGMRFLVNSCRPIPLLLLGARKGYAGNVTFQVTWKNLQKRLTKLAKAAELGYTISPDFKKKKLTFEVYKGVDHSTTQKSNPHVIFSEEYGNLQQAQRTYDESGYKNLFYIGGEGEGADRKIVVLGDETAENIREVFIDAKDLKQDKLTPEEYTQKLLQRGYEKAAEYNVKSAIEATTLNTNFEYNKHWDLGDIVTVKKRKWNYREDVRITEVVEVYENGGVSITPVFGDNLADTYDADE